MYTVLLGERLRSIRRQRGLSLQEVQRLTDGEFKAAVLGAYERGERSLSVPRLRRLAEVYGVPLTQLLPPDDGAAGPPPSGGDGVTIDLNKLEDLTGTDATILERFLRAIQMQRQDFNGRVLSIRRDDLRMLATLMDQTEDSFNDRLGVSNGD